MPRFRRMYMFFAALVVRGATQSLDVDACQNRTDGQECSFAAALNTVRHGKCARLGSGNHSRFACLPFAENLGPGVTAIKLFDPTCDHGRLHLRTGACCPFDCGDCVIGRVGVQDRCSVEFILRASPKCSVSTPPCVVAATQGVSPTGFLLNTQTSSGQLLPKTTGSGTQASPSPASSEDSFGIEDLSRPEVAALLAGGIGSCLCCGCWSCFFRCLRSYDDSDVPQSPHDIEPMRTAKGKKAKEKTGRKKKKKRKLPKQKADAAGGKASQVLADDRADAAEAGLVSDEDDCPLRTLADSHARMPNRDATSSHATDSPDKSASPMPRETSTDELLGLGHLDDRRHRKERQKKPSAWEEVLGLGLADDAMTMKDRDLHDEAPVPIIDIWADRSSGPTTPMAHSLPAPPKPTTPVNSLAAAPQTKPQQSGGLLVEPSGRRPSSTAISKSGKTDVARKQGKLSAPASNSSAPLKSDSMQNHRSKQRSAVAGKKKSKRAETVGGKIVASEPPEIQTSAETSDPKPSMTRKVAPAALDQLETAEEFRVSSSEDEPDTAAFTSVGASDSSVKRQRGAQAAEPDVLDTQVSHGSSNSKDAKWHSKWDDMQADIEALDDDAPPVSTSPLARSGSGVGTIK